MTQRARIDAEKRFHVVIIDIREVPARAYIAGYTCLVIGMGGKCGLAG